MQKIIRIANKKAHSGKIKKETRLLVDTSKANTNDGNTGLRFLNPD